MIAINNVLNRALVALAAASGGPLFGAKVRLNSNNIQPGPHTVLADLTEATFDGYAASAAVVWGTPLTDASGNAVSQPPSVQFTCTGSTTPEVVFGYYLTTGTSPLVYVGGEKFISPVPINDVGDGLIVAPSFGIPEGG